MNSTKKTINLMIQYIKEKELKDEFLYYTLMQVGCDNNIDNINLSDYDFIVSKVNEFNRS